MASRKAPAAPPGGMPGREQPEPGHTTPGGVPPKGSDGPIEREDDQPGMVGPESAVKGGNVLRGGRMVHGHRS